VALNSAECRLEPLAEAECRAVGRANRSVPSVSPTLTEEPSGVVGSVAPLAQIDRPVTRRPACVAELAAPTGPLAGLVVLLVPPPGAALHAADARGDHSETRLPGTGFLRNISMGSSICLISTIH